ncbi:MAG: hypothetical protein R3324_00340 [Halobacteriales archaeon]|nr:hypothetical protein [Halobacteriales archaeon]
MNEIVIEQGAEIGQIRAKSRLFERRLEGLQSAHQALIAALKWKEIDPIELLKEHEKHLEAEKEKAEKEGSREVEPTKGKKPVEEAPEAVEPAAELPEGEPMEEDDASAAP